MSNKDKQKSPTGPLTIGDVPKKRAARAQARIVTYGAPLTGKRKPLKPREAKFVEIYAGADGTITFQALGTIYIDRKEIRHGSIDSMSKEEVQKKLEALRKLYQGSPDVVDAQITSSIAYEKTVDHTEEFLNEAGASVLSEDEEGDDEGEDNGLMLWPNRGYCWPQL
jgi:hypothetical protein